ncbi:5-formyltetrahydrofolate cyclo-ligase [Anabrus simplex]|uniref:5-formyltetrahydrofolate cyclo-ligase n=1 Tax=Anabrus simplex TaxID=316456 RepID=UPI0035A2F504
MARVVAAKRALRKDIQKLVSSLSEEERRRQSAAVTAKLLKTPQYVSSRRVAVYLNLPNEVATRAIVQDVLASKKLCFVPRFDPESDHMDMVRVYSMEDVQNLPLTKYNVQQPALEEIREDALSTGGLDLVVVPGVAFTRCGQRLGHGKGYYDSFLARCPGPLFTVALAFSQQVVPELPTEPHDRIINLVLHPD